MTDLLSAPAQLDAVPFLDLRASHAELREAILADVAALLDSCAFTNGPAVGEFEQAFGAYCGVSECVGVASGLDGLRLALLAAGLEPGSEVVVPAMTFVATLEAVTQAGLVPVLADVRDDDYCLDPEAAAAAATGRAGALLPVHLYGQVADMGALGELARNRSLFLLEDACQAHGASRSGVRAGVAGGAAAFSFYPGKNLGAIGDAGAVVTKDGALAERVRMLREHGQSRKYVHDVEGWTARLDTIQALVLLRKLGRLDEWTEQRRAAARFYSDALTGVGDLVLPQIVDGSEPVWHLYVVRTKSPAALGEALGARGIGTGRHYPEPVHLTSAYRSLGHGAGSFPVAEQLASEVLSLPLFPGMTERQLESVVAAVRAYFDGA